MPDLTVRPAIIEDAAAIARNIRECDRLELLASTRLSPEKAIKTSIELSAACWTAEKDGVPIAVFGVCAIDMLAGVGSPWLLASKDCDSVIVPFVKLTRVYIPVMLKLFPVLENMVDVRNTKSIRWLKRLGFTFYAPEPHAYSGMPFSKFEMRFSDV